MIKLKKILLRVALAASCSFVFLIMGRCILRACARPVCFVDEVRHDFGECEQGDVLVHRFTFENLSDSEFRVVSINSSCGCTVVTDVPLALVGAGGVLVVPVRFNVGAREGKVSSRVTVRCEDSRAKRTSILLELVATVRSEYRLTSEFLDFGVLDPFGGVVQDTVALDGASGVVIEKVAVTGKHVMAKIKSSRSIVVSVSPEDSSGVISADVLVYTNSSRVPVRRIRVSAEVPRPVIVSPAQVIIDSRHSGPYEAKIHLQSDQLFRIS